jgi:hypothetical protein
LFINAITSERSSLLVEHASEAHEKRRPDIPPPTLLSAPKTVSTEMKENEGEGTHVM